MYDIDQQRKVSGSEIYGIRSRIEEVIAVKCCTKLGDFLTPLALSQILLLWTLFLGLVSSFLLPRNDQKRGLFWGSPHFDRLSRFAKATAFMMKVLSLTLPAPCPITPRWPSPPALTSGSCACKNISSSKPLNDLTLSHYDDLL